MSDRRNFLSTQGSFACVTWGRVLLPDVGSSSSLPLYFHKELDVLLGFESEAKREDEWKHNACITSDIPKHHDVNWLTGFHQYESILRLTHKHAEFFLLELLIWMSNTKAYQFEISGDVNYIMMLLSTKTVPNWLLFVAQ